MICFRDRLYCSSNCIQKTCDMHFSAADRAAAEKWWGGPDAPVAMSDFSPTCPDYKGPKNE